MDSLTSWVRASAERYVQPLSRRWRHVLAVGALAERIVPAFGDDAETLVAAAYLHDVGYAPELARSGFHPLDRGRFVRGQGSERVACLVAHHSGARLEAQLRGIDSYEEEFRFENGPSTTLLHSVSLTTGPDGSPVTLSWRVENIIERYGPEAVTARAIAARLSEFKRACRLTEQRVAQPVSGSRVGRP